MQLQTLAASVPPMRTLIFSLAAAALFSASAVAQDEAAAPPAQLPPDAEEAVVEYGGPEPLTVRSGDSGVEFSVEIADEPRSRSRGMMYRDAVGENEGMLFLYGSPRVVSIWMKNTQIPLDVIYIKSDGVIAKIVRQAVPFSLQSLSSETPVQGILEIGGGQAEALGIQTGDVVEHAAFGTAQQPAPANDNDVPADDADSEEPATDAAQ